MFLNQNTTTNFFYIFKDGSSYTFKKCVLETNFGDQLKKDFILNLEKIKRKNKSGLLFEEYSPIAETNKKLYEFKSKINKPILYDFYDNPKNYSTLKELDFAKTPIAYVIIFEIRNQQKAYFYKRVFWNNILKKDKAYRFLFDEEKLKEIKKDIFVISKDFDCVLFEDFLLINNKSGYEYIFDLEGEFKNISKIVLKELNKAIPIENYSKFESHCLKNIIIMRKIAVIERNGVYSKIKFADFKKKKHDFRLKVKLDEINKKIIFRKYKEIWEILTVFDDSYYESDITSVKYDARVKKKV